LVYKIKRFLTFVGMTRHLDI